MVAEAYRNTAIKHEGARYEIYWTTMYAKHVLDNYAKPTHGVKHSEISRLLKHAGYVAPLEARRPHLHRFVTEYQGTCYETYALLLPATATYPARCVVITCYKSGNLRHFLPQYASQLI